MLVLRWILRKYGARCEINKWKSGCGPVDVCCHSRELTYRFNGGLLEQLSELQEGSVFIELFSWLTSIGYQGWIFSSPEIIFRSEPVLLWRWALLNKNVQHYVTVGSWGLRTARLILEADEDERLKLPYRPHGNSATTCVCPMSDRIS